MPYTKLLRRFSERVPCYQEANYWHVPRFFSRGEISLFEKYADPNALLTQLRAPVTLIGEEIWQQSDGITDKLTTFPKIAVNHLKRGLTLEVDHLDLYNPEHKPLIDGLRKRLGLPSAAGGKSILYVSPPSSGFGAHFDAYTNIIFQVRGSKLWKLAPNTQAPQPMEHFEAEHYPLLSNELARYWQGEPPSDWQHITMQEGDMLFLPRGFWHQTEGASSDASISYNVTFSIPTRIDAALTELRQKLIGECRMREALVLRDGQEDTPAQPDVYQSALRGFRRSLMFGQDICS